MIMGYLAGMFLKNRHVEYQRLFLPAFAALFLLISPVYATEQNSEGLNAATKALDDVHKNLQLSEERIKTLNEEVAALKKDQETLSVALVDAAKSERLAAENITTSEKKLADLAGQENKVRQKLIAGRTEFAEVLAALQRMGLKPPPAILISPDDALTSVHSAVLLGAIVPEMRTRVMKLSATLKELASVRQEISYEHNRRLQEQTKQAEEQSRLKLLLAEKAKLQKTSESKMEEQYQLMVELSRKARSLEDLVTELNRQKEWLTSRGGYSDDTQSPQLTNKMDFNLLRGQLQRPVSGKLIRRFGVSGAQGETLETTPAAIVIAPVDATVAYADNFRSYGQLAILEVGNDYRILIAGMEHLDVSPGQFVLAGEPIGTMGSQLIASAAAFDIGKSAPILYIEFRQGKEGKPIDPAPWWARRTLGGNNNDS